MRIVSDLIYKVMSGEVPPNKIAEFRNNMTPAMRKRFDSGLRGFAMTSLAAFVGATFNVDTANQLTGDANYLFNQDKLEFKLMPSAIRTIHNGFGSLSN
jgi:hypothetical protein